MKRAILLSLLVASCVLASEPTGGGSTVLGRTVFNTRTGIRYDTVSAAEALAQSGDVVYVYSGSLIPAGYCPPTGVTVIDVANNVRHTNPSGALTLARPVTATAITGSYGGGIDTLLKPMVNAHPTYLFATGGTTSRLYRSSDGSTFALTAATTALNPSGFVWSFRNGVILAATGATGATYKVYRSADNGATLTEVIGSGASVATSTTGYFNDWSFAEGTAGTAILTEYGNKSGDTAVGNRVFLTQDWGATWTIVLDNADLDAADKWHHIHCPAWHPDLRKWVISVGDTDRARLFTLDADGSNLTNLIPQPRGPQPAWFLDYGDPTKLLYGDDNYTQVATLDVSTGALGIMWQGWLQNANRPFSWFGAVDDGIYYAFQQDGTTTGQIRTESTIIAARDPEDGWGVVYTWPATVSGVRSCVPFGDLLHVKTNLAAGGEGYYTITPATLSRKTPVDVTPERTNSEKATCTTATTAWFGTQGDVAVEADAGIDGADCIKITGNASGVLLQAARLGDTATVSAGSSYVVSAWIKPTNRDCAIQFSATIDSADSGDAAQYLCPVNQWTRVTSKMITIPAGGDDASLRIKSGAAEDNAAGVAPVLLVDHIMVTEAPAPNEFITAGETSTASSVSKYITAGVAWTDGIWFAPTASYWSLISPRHLPVASWNLYTWTAGSATITLKWEAGPVRSTLTGTPGTTITSADNIFREDMVGELCYMHNAAAGASTTAKISAFTAANEVDLAATAEARSADDYVSVEAPRFELAIDNGDATTESIYSDRAPLLKDAATAIAVQVAGDGKVYAWMLHGGALSTFKQSDGETAGSSNTFTEFQSKVITAAYAATGGMPGKLVVLDATGYVASGDIDDYLTD